MHELWIACGLVLVIEGFLYSLFPQQMKQALIQIIAMPASQIRLFGMISLAIGWGIVWFLKH
ncbi:MAG: DUF2065 domain-containing protein [Mariprofundaceae bacterium]|nr:DUF2065 domain-containing protein [Mariprofundaceae bacterium]